MKDEKEESEDEIVCRCRDVTVKDIENAIDDGYNTLELLKRKTKVTTGTCQGRTCLELVQRILARKTGKQIKDMEKPSDRSPIIPVPMRFIAGEKEEG